MPKLSSDPKQNPKAGPPSTLDDLNNQAQSSTKKTDLPSPLADTKSGSATSSPPPMGEMGKMTQAAPPKPSSPPLPSMQGGGPPTTEETKPQKEKETEQFEERLKTLDVKTPPPGKPKKSRIIMAVIALLFVLASVPAAVYLVQQRQELRKAADQPCTGCYWEDGTPNWSCPGDPPDWCDCCCGDEGATCPDDDKAGCGCPVGGTPDCSRWGGVCGDADHDMCECSGGANPQWTGNKCLMAPGDCGGGWQWYIDHPDCPQSGSCTGAGGQPTPTPTTGGGGVLTPTPTYSPDWRSVNCPGSPEGSACCCAGVNPGPACDQGCLFAYPAPYDPADGTVIQFCDTSSGVWLPSWQSRDETDCDDQGFCSGIDTIPGPDEGTCTFCNNEWRRPPTGGGTTPTPTSTPGGNGGPTPTPTSAILTPTPTGSVTATCAGIIVHDIEWSLLSPGDLEALQAGDHIYFGAYGWENVLLPGITYTEARFRINGGAWINTTSVHDFPGPVEPTLFYIEYIIPAGVTTFAVDAEVYSPSCDCWR